MNKESRDIDQILPSGEMLRGFMEQSFVTKSDLKGLLRTRGVFTCNNEKQDSIPILMATILSPNEFDLLRECQSSREDNPKIVSQTIDWESGKNLLESLPDIFDLNSMLDLEFSNFKVNGSPNFVPVDGDPDHLVMEFSVEREDMTKSWASSKSVYPGSLEMTRVQEDEEVKLVITHTANETKYVATKASTNLVKHFKKSGSISSTKEIEKITFDKFSNPKRIEYFLALSKGGSSSLLKFVEIIDLEFSPDQKKSLPDNMDWMAKKIDDLKLNGSDLHKTFFVKEKSNHEFINIYRVDAKFKFDIKGLTGQCVVTIHFPDYAKSKSEMSELEVNIKQLAFDEIPRGISKSEIKKMILKDIDSQKVKKYKEFADKR